jgi:hypothetical protein
MNAKTWRGAGVYVLVAVPMIGLAGIAVIAKQNQDTAQQQTTDPVADAARKAREQKKEATKPKKVYTNEDFGSSAGSSGGASQSSTANPGTPATSAAKQEANAQAGSDSTPSDATSSDKNAAGGAGKNDEETWRKKFREARGKLADAEKELDILQREAQKAQVQYYSDPQKAMSEQYSRKDINDKDTKIAAKKQEVEQLKQHISDMEDELRRSGGDIGWARE